MVLTRSQAAAAPAPTSASTQSSTSAISYAPSDGVCELNAPYPEWEALNLAVSRHPAYGGLKAELLAARAEDSAHRLHPGPDPGNYEGARIQNRLIHANHMLRIFIKFVRQTGGEDWRAPVLPENWWDFNAADDYGGATTGPAVSDELLTTEELNALNPEWERLHLGVVRHPAYPTIKAELLAACAAQLASVAATNVRYTGPDLAAHISEGASVQKRCIDAHTVMKIFIRFVEETGGEDWRMPRLPERWQDFNGREGEELWR